MTETTNFEDTLKVGLFLQREVLAVVKKKYPQAKQAPDGNFPDYDLIIPETGDTIETKDQNNSEFNFFFEIAWNGQPSGLEKTKATWFVVGWKEWLYWWRTEELKKFIAATNYEKKTYDKGKLTSKIGEAPNVVEGYSIPRVDLEAVTSFKKIAKITNGRECYLDGCNEPCLNDVGSGNFCSKEHHDKWADATYGRKVGGQSHHLSYIQNRLKEMGEESREKSKKQEIEAITHRDFENGEIAMPVIEEGEVVEEETDEDIVETAAEIFGVQVPSITTNETQTHAEQIKIDTV